MRSRSWLPQADARPDNPKLKSFNDLEDLEVDIGSWSESDLKRAQMVLPKHHKVHYSQEKLDQLDDLK
jgi:hypothetical protein